MDLRALFIRLPKRRRYLTKTLLIMKLTAIIILGVCLQVSASGFSQSVTLSVKEEALTKVFSAIEKQTGYVFFYDGNLLHQSKPVTISVKDEPLEKVLREALKDQELDFSIENKTINVFKKAQKVEQLPSTNSVKETSNIDVHGKVTDSLGSPLEGATITIKGQKKGMYTGSDGTFTLHDVPENATVIISFVGYETREMKIGGKTAIVVSLKHAEESLRDVIVNKGYYTETQELSVGDVSIVKGEDIAKQPVGDPLMALEGRVPGLYIQQSSGIPGQYSQVFLRGQNFLVNDNIASFTQNDPLYIVDGVPFGSQTQTQFIAAGLSGELGTPSYPSSSRGVGLSPFNILNPTDIESIEVLKDADATAIYGARGANGVILITTKRGKPGKVKFDLNMSSGLSSVTKELPMMNTTQYLQMRREGFINDGFYNYLLNPNFGHYWPDMGVGGLWDTTRNTNWQKVLIGSHSASFTNMVTSLSGGTANTQFLVSGAYNKQSTLYPGNFGDEKGSFLMNITHSSTNRHFKIDIHASYGIDHDNVPQAGYTSGLAMAPDAPPVYDKFGNINWQVVNGTATFNNPIAGKINSNITSSTNLNSGILISYQISSGLSFKTSAGYNRSEGDQLILHLASSVGPPNNTPLQRQSGRGNNVSETWNVEPQLAYSKKFFFGSLHFLVGGTFQSTQNNSNTVYGQGYSTDALVANPAAAAQYTYGFNTSQYRYNSIYANLGYNWQEKYIINLTARRDGSSRFGPGKQFGDFGSAGIGWIFSKGALIQRLFPLLSFGKIKASYGTVGNDGIGDYQFMSLYGFQSGGSTYGNSTYLTSSGLSNPYYQWQSTKKEEAGIDLGFLKDRIMLSAVYYFTYTINQLSPYSLPLQTGGGSSIIYNLPAKIENYGEEFVLATTNIKSKSFTWKSSLNLSLPQNKIASFPGLESSPSNRTYVLGRSIFSKYVYHYLGVDPQTGVYTFATKDPSNQPIYGLDFIPSKPVTQQSFGGFDNSFDYDGWHLDIFLQFVKQNSYSYQVGFLAPGITSGLRSNQPIWALNRWEKPGDKAAIERTTESTNSNSYQAYRNLLISDGVIVDASFIRVKNVSLSYQFNPNWLKKSHLQSLNVFVHAQNLFVLTKYRGLDPETGPGLIPPLRTVTAGLNVSL